MVHDLYNRGVLAIETFWNPFNLLNSNTHFQIRDNRIRFYIFTRIYSRQFLLINSSSNLERDIFFHTVKNISNLRNSFLSIIMFDHHSAGELSSNNVMLRIPSTVDTCTCQSCKSSDSKQRTWYRTIRSCVSVHYIIVSFIPAQVNTAIIPHTHTHYLATIYIPCRNIKLREFRNKREEDRLKRVEMMVDGGWKVQAWVVKKKKKKRKKTSTFL